MNYPYNLCAAYGGHVRLKQKNTCSNVIYTLSHWLCVCVVWETLINLFCHY